jgi:hypothetical protein
MQIVQKRKKSKVGSLNPNVVDFSYNGNANSFAHLLKNHYGKPPTPVELNFECQLRTYKSKTDCTHKHRWINAFQKPIHIEDGTVNKGSPKRKKAVRKVKGKQQFLNSL